MNRIAILSTPLALVAALILATAPILGSTSPAFAAQATTTPTATEVQDRVVPPFICFTILVYIAGTVTYDDQGRPIHDSGGQWVYHWICEVPIQTATNVAEAYAETEEEVSSGYREAAEAVVDAITGLFD
ncbi:MAG: hypothetical protein F4086_17670 [Gemmatimonadetes bacterium]|nr:hypothetical protein [Dehalococcoidia bacterium]MYJ12135.1 hypothetical protein [Gemmatimonadota bacterium]